MRKLLFISTLIIFIGCEKDDNEIIKIDNSPLTHAELGFELDEPNVILNELAKGELDKSINSIFLLMYGNTERKWEFEYIDNTDKVSKMIYYLPHYQYCEKNIYQFHYNNENFIEQVISTRKNLCLEFEAVKTYTFNYNENGLLKSIFLDSEFMFQEYYIGYYHNGKVKEIWFNSRRRGDEVDFSNTKYFYDEDFKNVIRLERQSSSQSYTYTYTYDDKKNPFKNYFISLVVFMPYVGPAYLSENNVSSLTEKNNNNIHNQEFTYYYSFEYSDSNKLESYRDMENERVYTINQ